MSSGTVGSLLVLALLACFSVLGATHEVFSHDVAYYLYVSREVLAGAEPFRDYIDPNLPTITYIGVPVAWLSGVLGIPIWVGFQAFVLALQAVSFGTSAYLVRARLARDDAPLGWLVVAALATGLCLVPMGLAGVDDSHFGQREHLAVLLLAPWTLWHAARATGLEVPRIWLALVLVLASLGLAIKPHFLLFWLVMEAWSFRRRAPGTAWPWVALAPPIAFGVYLLVLVAALPEFPTLMGYTWQLYGAYKDRTPFEVATIAPSLFALSVLAVHALSPSSGPLRPLRSTLAVATLGWWLVGFMQLRGFYYHFLPAMVMAFVLAVVILASFERLRRAIPLVYGLLVVVGFGSFEIAARDPGSGDMQLARLMREAAKGGPVMVLSSNTWPGWPAALYADVRWASRFPTLWFVPGFYQDVADGDAFPIRRPSEMGPLEAWHLDAVLEDFRRNQPTLILVDQLPVQPGFGGNHFDFVAYLGRDPRFRELWCGYRKTGNWMRVFDAYERDPELAARCASGQDTEEDG